MLDIATSVPVIRGVVDILCDPNMDLGFETIDPKSLTNRADEGY